MRNVFKFLSLALLALVLLTGHAEAAWSPIAHTAKGGAASTSTSVVTTAINTTGANLIIVTASYFNTAAGNISITDSATNTWTTAFQSVAPASTLNISIFFIVSPTTSATHTFTMTVSGGGTTFPAVEVDSFSGSASSSPGDQKSGIGSASTTTLAPGSITPTQANELVYNVSTSGNNTINSISAGTITNNLACSGGSVFDCVASAWIAQTTATATNPTWTFGAAGTTATVAQATFFATGGAPIATTPIIMGPF